MNSYSIKKYRHCDLTGYKAIDDATGALIALNGISSLRPSDSAMDALREKTERDAEKWRARIECFGIALFH
jgi:hypothetical protein